jgi:hypothetical protein
LDPAVAAHPRVEASSSPGPATPTDLASELERVADLHAQGALTDEEFAAAKAALLTSVAPPTEAKP